MLELMISLGILSVAVAITLTVVQAAMKGFDSNVANTRVNSELTRGLNRVARALTPAGLAPLAPALEAPFSSDDVTFQEVVAWNAGAPVWSGDVALRFEYENGELDNGLDDDGDGFVDEGQVALIRDQGGPDQQRSVLVKSVREFLEGETPGGGDENGNGLVDERGFCLEVQGESLVIRLSVQRSDPQVGVILRTMQTTVHLRN